MNSVKELKEWSKTEQMLVELQKQVRCSWDHAVNDCLEREDKICPPPAGRDLNWHMSMSYMRMKVILVTAGKINFHHEAGQQKLKQEAGSVEVTSDQYKVARYKMMEKLRKNSWRAPHLRKRSREFGQRKMFTGCEAATLQNTQIIEYSAMTGMQAVSQLSEKLVMIFE